MSREEFVGIGAAARLAKTSRQLIWRRIHSGELPAFTDPLDRRTTLLRRADLEPLLVARIALPGERLVRRGERGDAMYFIASGAVEVQPPGSKVIRLGTGDPRISTAP